MSKQDKSTLQTELNRILEIFRNIAKISANGNYIFRGESELYPKISSNLYRKLEKVELLYLGVETVQQEELAYAKRYIKKTDDFEILTEIQHFGGKTNLIDFTTDYHIALFFSCDSSPSKDGRIILLDKMGTMKAWIRDPSDSGTESRVRVQKSIFVRPPEGVIEPDKEVIIPKDLKQPILKYLEKEFDVSRQTIYPDLHGFVSSQENRWDVYEAFGSGVACLERGDEVDNPERKDKYYQEAVKHFTSAIQLIPEYYGAYQGRSNAYREIGHLDKAINDADEAIRLEPDHFLSYYARGLTYFFKGELDNSIADFKKGLNLHPKYAEGYHILGLAYSSQGDIGNAIASLDEAILLNPSNALFYLGRGLNYSKKGYFDLAVEDYKKAIELDSELAHAYYNRGEAWLHLKEWDKARSDLTVAKSMRIDIVAAFHNTYRDISTFERRNDVKMPKDIVEMLMQYPINPFTTTQKVVTHDGEIRESAAVLELLEKFRNAGKPLREYLQEHPSRGITTGYNEAFIVERETRDVLIAEHSSSSEILKPFLMTRDINRWRVNPQDKWLIFTHHGIDIDAYPAIKKHLEKHKDTLKKRSGKQEWYELQIASRDMDRLEQPKCIYPHTASETAFAFDDEGYYVSSTAYLLSTDQLWLLGVLNTKAVSWFYARTAPQIRGPFLKFTSRYVSQIPIPDMEQEQRALIHKIVEYILYLKKQPTTDGKDLANSSDYVMLAYFGHILDDLVYELYLPDELHQGNKYFFQPLLDEKLPQLEEIQGNKMFAFRELFEHLFHKDHPVQRNHFFLDSVQSIRIIESKA